MHPAYSPELRLRDAVDTGGFLEVQTNRKIRETSVLEINPARSFMRDSLLSSLEETGPIT